MNDKLTKQKWLDFYRKQKHWKLNDILLFLKHKISTDDNYNENEEKIDYDTTKMEN